MPEGPTLVVFKKDFEKFEGRKITESGGYRNPFAENLAGQKLLEVKTYGKYLILQFKEFFVTIHFALFGKYMVNGVKKVNPSFSIHFDNDFINCYVVNVKKTEGKSEDYFDAELDPFSKKFNAEKVIELLLKKLPKKKIGDALMNQEIFPGLGNVIRNEILFFAKIHPESIVEKIPEKKLEELLNHFKEFSLASVEMIQKKIWKSSSAVYRKEKLGKEEIKMYISPAIKRKTFVAEGIQKLYE